MFEPRSRLFHFVIEDSSDATGTDKSSPVSPDGRIGDGRSVRHHVVRAGAGARLAASERIVMATIGGGGQGTGDMQGFLGFPQVQVVAV